MVFCVLIGVWSSLKLFRAFEPIGARQVRGVNAVRGRLVMPVSILIWGWEPRWGQCIQLPCVDLIDGSCSEYEGFD